MLNIIKKLLIKIKEYQYKRYIEKHIANVFDAFVEMVMCEDLKWAFDDDEIIYNSMLDRVDVHDESKYSDEEFDAYRKNFYPINKKEKEENKADFEKAWQHHLDNNRHHWQARVKDTKFDLDTQVDILENVCDWLAMGYEFHNRPCEYYEGIKDEVRKQLPKEQVEFLERVIYEGIDKKYLEEREQKKND